MGHGDHWGAVEKDVDAFLETMLPLICKEGKPVGENNFCHSLEEVEKKNGVVYGLQYPEFESPVSFLGLVVGQIHEEGNLLWTAYPVCAEGPCTRLVVDEVKLCTNGIEGTVEAYMPEGDSVCFYDPFFFLNKEKYQEWAEIDVALSALAYLVEKAEPEEDDPADEELPESSEEEMAETASESDSSAEASLPEVEEIPAEYYPRGEQGDSAEIELIVEEAVPVACVGRLFWRLTGVIMRADNAEEMRIHVYASEQVLKGYVPQPGDDVLAIVWMQGRLLQVAQAPS
jgi:hypothetical protein